MSTLQAIQAGMYLYGITQADAGPLPALPGIDGGTVEILPVEGLAAVVTRVERKKIRAQRANLSAHHQILRRLAERHTVLPCAFGTVAAGEDQLRDFLRRNRDRLANQLKLLRGKVEMSLSVFWNTSNIFEFFVATHDELREMRNRVFQPGREPSLEERLELGKMFESLLRQCRERHMKQVIEVLSPYCTEIRSVDAGSEEMIMKLVCLVPKEDQARFEVGIQAAARKFDDHYCFKYSGPWAPFDFVDVQIEM
jgi:hypothetical protein